MYVLCFSIISCHRYIFLQKYHNIEYIYDQFRDDPSLYLCMCSTYFLGCSQQFLISFAAWSMRLWWLEKRLLNFYSMAGCLHSCIQCILTKCSPGWKHSSLTATWLIGNYTHSSKSRYRSLTREVLRHICLGISDRYRVIRKKF